MQHIYQMALLLAFCLLSLSSSCLSIAPEWPSNFVTNWTIYNVPNTDPWPPFDVPPPPYNAGRGLTYYDWSSKSMLEVYEDFCVPIFPNGSNWQCKFLNTKGVSYLISTDPKTGYAPCCVFGQPWNPPSPTFLRNSGIIKNVTSSIGNKSVSWWVMNGSADEGAPFGYGFFNETKQGWQVPAAFFFRAFQGWTQQNFFNWQPIRPSPSVFNIPSACIKAKSCNYL